VPTPLGAKDLEGTSNKPDVKDLEGTSNSSQRDTMVTIMRGAVCPGSEDRGQASAAGTSRQADGRAGAANTLARARKMNATPTPRISSPNAPEDLDPEDGGRNRVVAGQKVSHRCRRYFGP